MMALGGYQQAPSYGRYGEGAVHPAVYGAFAAGSASIMDPCVALYTLVWTLASACKLSVMRRYVPYFQQQAAEAYSNVNFGQPAMPTGINMSYPPVFTTHPAFDLDITSGLNLSGLQLDDQRHVAATELASTTARQDQPGSTSGYDQLSPLSLPDKGRAI